ncbi:MAG: patatin-like phospholipase family protein [Rhodospirillum sp.]|nr:patatin-like phospholipase family protein [Rhodospirillum sp.]MCF8488143.1 patatin-like phospholipase family protein [Rhodospirillum sp.]
MSPSAADASAIASLRAQLPFAALPPEAWEVLLEQIRVLDGPAVDLSTRDGLLFAPRRPSGESPAFQALAPHDIRSDATWPEGMILPVDRPLLAIDGLTLRRAYQVAPGAFRTHGDHAEACALQSRISSMLRRRSVFRDASEALLSDLETQLSVRIQAGGERIFVQGDASDHLLILVSGMVRASVTDPSGRVVVFPPIGPGTTVGEMGVILGDVRGADLTAVRDCETLVMDKATYEALLTTHPLEMNRIFSKAIRDHLSKPSNERGGTRPSTLALVSLGDPALAMVAARELSPAFSFLGRIGTLTREDSEAMAEFGKGVETAHFNAIEQSVDLLLYIADEMEGPWKDRCLRQADHILFVAEWEDDSALRPIEIRQIQDRTLSMKGHGLLVLHPADAPKPRRAADWRKGRKDITPHHLRLGVASDAGRVARSLVGRARGVVLGGGGARGFAHLGLLRVLQEKGIDVDVVGGNSMGALLGAQFARGDDLETILTRTVTFAHNGDFPTLPIVSLLVGKRYARATEELCGGLDFEDLWIPFFTVACDLTTAETRVLDSGPLHLGVRASNSPAGIFPPTLIDGHLLVDGAILNNVPVDVMRDRVGKGTVIAADVNPRQELAVDPTLRRLSGLDALFRMIFRRQSLLPTLPEILVRAGIVGGIAHRDRTKGLADLYLEPPVSQFPLIAYGKARAIAAIGEEAARVALANWSPDDNGMGNT